MRRVIRSFSIHKQISNSRKFSSISDAVEMVGKEAADKYLRSMDLNGGIIVIYI